MAQAETTASEMQAEKQEQEQMCCEGGMTAAEHRSKSPDGKCCTDE